MCTQEQGYGNGSDGGVWSTRLAWTAVEGQEPPQLLLSIAYTRHPKTSCDKPEKKDAWCCRPPVLWVLTFFMEAQEQSWTIQTRISMAVFQSDLVYEQWNWNLTWFLWVTKCYSPFVSCPFFSPQLFKHVKTVLSSLVTKITGSGPRWLVGCWFSFRPLG